MNEGNTCYYVRLEANDARYWHWRIAKRDHLDVYYDGEWHVMLAWKDLLTVARPTAEVTLMLRSDFLAGGKPETRPKRALPVAAPSASLFRSRYARRVLGA